MLLRWQRWLGLRSSDCAVHVRWRVWRHPASLSHDRSEILTTKREAQRHPAHRPSSTRHRQSRYGNLDWNSDGHGNVNLGGFALRMGSCTRSLLATSLTGFSARLGVPWTLGRSLHATGRPARLGFSALAPLAPAFSRGRCAVQICHVHICARDRVTCSATARRAQAQTQAHVLLAN